MMKVILFVALFSFLLLSVTLGIPNGLAKVSPDQISIEITNIQRAPLQSGDLIVLDFIFINEGKTVYDLSAMNLVLYDSESRIYESVSSFQLSDQQDIDSFAVSCDFYIYYQIQAGVPTPVRDVCFLVPQDRSLSYGILLAESNYEWCDNSNPYLKQDCRTQPIGKISLTSMEVEEVASSDPTPSGCLIATATYGSELTDEVQNLREIRNKMYETETGGELMKSVNEFYYSFSPTVSDWERENPILRESVKLLITPAMISFTVLDHESISSDQDLINYVVSITFLNIGMYFVAPAVLIMKVRKRI